MLTKSSPLILSAANQFDNAEIVAKSRFMEAPALHLTPPVKQDNQQAIV